MSPVMCNAATQAQSRCASSYSQVEVTGSDAYRFVEYITSRDLSKLQIGQGKYALITDENGGIINDPIILRLGESHFWLSIADSDVLLWTRGLACGLGWDVNICEPDVSPLAIQGPSWIHMVSPVKPSSTPSQYSPVLVQTLPFLVLETVITMF